MSNKDKKKRVLLLFGAPGSGKGTQGKILGGIPNFVHFSCGDVFRSLDINSELGKRFAEYSKTGDLVPDTLTIELWANHLRKMEQGGTYDSSKDILILDGIPRNVEQAKMLEEYIQVEAVIHLSCGDRAELIRRMRSRALHENRLDDANEEVVKNRIAIYEKETKPILDYYPSTLVHNIEGLQTPVQVLADILAYCKSI